MRKITNISSRHRARDNFGHRLFTQTNRIALARRSQLENMRPNLSFSYPRLLLGPQRRPRFVENGLQKLQGVAVQLIHILTRTRRVARRTNPALAIGGVCSRRSPVAIKTFSNRENSRGRIPSLVLFWGPLE